MLLECYTEEATSALYFRLFQLLCYCLTGPVNLPSSCCASGLAGNGNKQCTTEQCFGFGILVISAIFVVLALFWHDQKTEIIRFRCLGRAETPNIQFLPKYISMFW